MKMRFAQLATLTITLLTTYGQAELQYPSSTIKPLALQLEADSRPTWEQAVNNFSSQLADAYQLDSETAGHFSTWIMDASERHFVPADLMAALINTESNFRIAVTSWADAVGPAQVIPRVWGKTCEGNLKEPGNNIQCGAFVLRHYYVRYCDAQSWQCALEYYHTGPGKMAKGDAYAQTRRSYVTKIDSNLSLLASGDNYDLLTQQNGRG
jgi:soluble lytic murein transglycosylase-like protein